ncbi:unnamed protein product [Ectocarpus sp. 6 AP-2014]
MFGEHPRQGEALRPAQLRPRVLPRMPPYVAQEQRSPEGYQPHVPRVPQGVVLPRAVEGTPQGEGQAEGHPGLQEGAVQAPVQVPQARRGLRRRNYHRMPVRLALLLRPPRRERQRRKGPRDARPTCAFAPHLPVPKGRRRRRRRRRGQLG